MQTALWQCGGEFSRECCCSGVIGGAGPWMGGVIGQSSGSNIFKTSFSLLVEGAWKGACKLSGSAAMLGAAAAGKKGIGIGEVG